MKAVAFPPERDSRRVLGATAIKLPQLLIDPSNLLKMALAEVSRLSEN
jgi:hypothetical protein